MSRFAALMGRDGRMARPPALSMSESLVKLARQNDLHKLHTKMEELGQQKVSLEERVYREYLIASTKSSAPGSLRRAWKQVVDARVRPSDDTLAKVFSSLCIRRKYAVAKGFRQELRKRGFSLKAQALVTYGDSLDPQTDEAEVQATCEEILNLGSGEAAQSLRVFTKLMMVYARRGDVYSVKQIFKQLHALDVLSQPNLETLSALIMAHGRQQELSAVLRILAKMEDGGLEHDIRSFNLTLDALLRCGDVGRVLKMFHMVREEQESGQQAKFRLNAASYNIVMDALARSGNLREAEGMLTTMKAASLRIRPIDLNVLLNAYAQAGMPDLARRLLDKYREVRVDALSHAIVTKAFLRAGKLGEAEDYLRDLVERRLDPSQLRDCLTTLITEYGKRREVERMQALWRQMKELGAASAKAYGVVVECLLSNGKVDEAWDAIDEMRERNLEPDLKMFTSVINLHARSGDLTRAVDTFGRMVERDIEPDLPCYNVLLKAYVRCGDIAGAEKVMQGMHEKEITGNAITYNTVMDAFAKRGDLRKALELFEQMKKLRVEPTTGNYNTLLSAYNAQDDVLGVKTIFAELMTKPHLEPSEITFNVVINALSAHGDLVGVTQVYEELQRRGLCDAIVSRDALLPLSRDPTEHRRASAALTPSFRRPGAAALVHQSHSAGDEAVLLPGWAADQDVPGGAGDQDGTQVQTGMNVAVTSQGLGVAEAEKAFESLERSGIAPDVSAYAALIHAYSRKGDLESAKGSFQQMVAQGLIPDIGAVNSLLWVCARHKDVDMAEEAMRTLDEHRIQPNVFTYNTMIYLYATKEDKDSVQKIRKHFKRRLAPQLAAVA